MMDSLLPDTFAVRLTEYCESYWKGSEAAKRALIWGVTDLLPETLMFDPTVSEGTRGFRDGWNDVIREVEECPNPPENGE